MTKEQLESFCQSFNDLQKERSRAYAKAYGREGTPWAPVRAMDVVFTYSFLSTGAKRWTVTVGSELEVGAGLSEEEALRAVFVRVENLAKSYGKAG